MPDTHPRIVRNSKRIACRECGATHDFFTRKAETAPCGTPVAYSYERAVKIANLMAAGVRDVERIPDNIIVIMDDSARRLPRSGTGTARNMQFARVERSA